MSIREPRPGVRIPPPPPPQDIPIYPPAPTASTTALPTWVPLAVAITALVVQQALVALHGLPQSAPIAVAIVILGSVGAVLAALPAILGQYTEHREIMAEQQQAHDLAMEHLRAQARQTLTAGTAR